MRAQDEKIKGFNILELIVVVVIIGVISAIGYPNFNKWRKDREARDAVVKIKSLIEGINAQVQRGQYAFVQVHVEEREISTNNDGLVITSKGMSPQTLAAFLNNGESDWWQDPNNRCNIDQANYWNDDPDPNGDLIVDLDSIEVRQIKLENVATTWTGEVGAVCFGKNERWFSGAGNLTSGTGSNVIVDNFLFICSRTNARTQCDVDATTGQPVTEHENLYAIEWSRFGNITLEKWNSRDLQWVAQ